ncbi:MAG TPA: hypothetical protein VF251_00180, partial [Pyrinomonadaceae bacterium]
GIMTDEQVAKQIEELLYQALETEKGGVEVYKTALRCALNEDLKEEWERYLEETQNHVEVVSDLLNEMGFDADTESPGRKVLRHISQSLVQAMEMALNEGPPEAAQLVACECVVHAETKDHLNWELIGELASTSDGDAADLLQDAYDVVEDEEDEHLYHTQGWARELWIDSLGLEAVLPPPEEVEDVETAIEAAEAKNARARHVS